MLRDYTTLVCGNTMYVSTCQVEFVLCRTVSLYYIPRTNFLTNKRFPSSEKNCPACLINYNTWTNLKLWTVCAQVCENCGTLDVTACKCDCFWGYNLADCSGK